MLAAVAASLLCASPEASVVVARRLGLDAARGAELAQQLTAALEQQPGSRLGALVPVTEATSRLTKAGFPDTAVCNGAAACVASLAKVGGFERLVALQLVKLGADLAIDASIIDGRTGASLAVVTRTVKLKAIGDELTALAAELMGKLPAKPVAEVAPPDRPPSTDPSPPPPPPLDETAVTATAARPLSTGRLVAIGLGSAAIVSLGVGIGLGVSALSQSNQLSVRDPEYASRVAAVRQTALFSDVGYGAAAAFAVAALVTWLLAPP